MMSDSAQGYLDLKASHMCMQRTVRIHALESKGICHRPWLGGSAKREPGIGTKNIFSDVKAHCDE